MSGHSIAEPFKRCSHCGNSYPPTLQFFSKNTKGKNGLQSQCKRCDKQYRTDNAVVIRKQTKEHRFATREQRNMQQRIARQKHPEVFQAYGKKRWLNHKESITAQQKARYDANAEQERAKARARRAKNPEYGRAYRKQYRKDHPEVHKAGAEVRRARKQGLPATFTGTDWKVALTYWHGACAVCGREEGFFWTLSADHWIPLATLGSPGTVPQNIIPLCHTKQGNQQSCNNTKHNREPLAWLTEKLGPRKAKQKLREIETYFTLVRTREA